MNGLRIEDKNEKDYLSFDLIDILKLVDNEINGSTWLCSGVWSMSENSPNIGDYSDTEEHIDTSKLIECVKNERQVIDGRFEAFEDNNKDPWLTVEAFDSSYWEVHSSNEDLLNKIESAFIKVEKINA